MRGGLSRGLEGTVLIRPSRPIKAPPPSASRPHSPHQAEVEYGIRPPQPSSFPHLAQVEDSAVGVAGVGVDREIPQLHRTVPPGATPLALPSRHR